MQTYLDVFSHLPTLLTPRLTLRPVRMSDAEDMYEYSRDPEVARHVLWDAHTSIHQTRNYLRYLIRQYRSAAPGTFAIALRDSGKVDGDKVVWDANFAKRVYNMPDSSKWTLDRGAIEPHSHWFEVAKSRHLGQWLDDTAEAMSKK